MELYYRVSLHLKDDSNDFYQLGNLKVNFKSGDVFVNHKPVSLTARELDLLYFFISNNNQILSKEQIYSKVWGYETFVDDNTLMVHIRTLRRKIEENPNQPKFIKTMRGKGYIFKGENHE
ncbi:winged helix-turn-helix domain-containing protein [Staphylococcus warneri]